MNFNEIFGKNVYYDDIKVTKNKALHSLHTVYFLKYILRLKVSFFFERTFNISFCRISNLLSYLNENKLQKNC